jgi:hypothetical protein
MAEPNPSKRSRLGAPCDYCIVGSTATLKEWEDVVTVLAAKHAALAPKVLPYAASLKDVLSELSSLLPKYTVFLARPTECSRVFVRAVHRLARALDPSHNYTDTIWGILCAPSLPDALQLARESQPLIIRRVVSGTVEGGELAMFEHGVAFNELEAGNMWTKAAGQAPESQSYSGDLLEHIAEALNSSAPDMIITSGHARERVW